MDAMERYFEQFVGDTERDAQPDTTPVCWWCGWKMEYDQEGVIEMDGGAWVVYEPRWRCVNETCLVGEPKEA